MYWLRLLSRVAFICNACFLLALLFQWMPHPPEGELVSVVIILGYVVAVLLNVAVNICYAFLLFSPARLRNNVPLWLIITNFLFLIPQLILFLK
jgi:hypothetical protein